MSLIRVMTLLIVFTTFLFARAPKWIENHPSSSTDYIGIAMASKEEFSTADEWRKAAELRALNNISSAISVSISGAASLQMSNDGTDQNELYREDIKSFTKANLEGYEFIDSWENRKEYWVYYKLDKMVWRQIEQRRLSEGVAKAKSFIANGKTQENSGHTLSAIRSYIQAFSEIVPILYLNPEIRDNNSRIPLVSHIDQHLVSVLNSMSFETKKPLYRGTRASFPNYEPSLTLSGAIGGVSSFPLMIEKSKRFTDSRGSVTISNSIIDTISRTGELLLSIETDIEQIIPAEEKSLLVRQWLSQMKWPTMTAQIIFEKPAVYIESIEDGYADLPYEQLETAVKERLGDIGYGIARFPEDAEYRIVIKSSTRPAGSMGNLYFTFLDVTWTLFSKSGDELMTDALQPVKGGALSFDDAGVKAYSKGSTLLADRIISWIKENR